MKHVNNFVIIWKVFDKKPSWTEILKFSHEWQFMFFASRIFIQAFKVKILIFENFQ